MDQGMKLLFGSPVSHVSVIGAFGGERRFEAQTTPILEEVMGVYEQVRSPAASLYNISKSI